jgi:hypothetical protein
MTTNLSRVRLILVPTKAVSNAPSTLEKPQYCLALTTWVIQPDLGIVEFQSLIKASAFVVKATAATPSVCHFLSFLSSSHDLSSSSFFFAPFFISY